MRTAYEVAQDTQRLKNADLKNIYVQYAQNML